ncbi:KdsC family phosphatase, partial [Klebsiella pneumoniae]|uniref:KdsC family phosphatase n=1 Tax=Klebsiella pneumoniae TaxID=573 RepID=UPI003970AB0E
MNQDLMQRGKEIKLAVFDVDGVLTDGRLYFLEDGSEFKTFNTLDGQGIKMLMASGVTTAIISGRKTPVVERRAKNLGIQLLDPQVADVAEVHRLVRTAKIGQAGRQPEM